MTTETLTLNAAPQDALRMLEKTVQTRLNWRIMTGGTHDQPRFVIEKPVRYNVLRGLNVIALFQVAGNLQPNQQGGTTLYYIVSGQSGIPLLLAGINLALLLGLAGVVGALAFSPTMGNTLVGVLPVGFILLAAALYGVFAYRSYQGHVRELHHLMRDVAQSTRGISSTATARV